MWLQDTNVKKRDLFQGRRRQKSFKQQYQDNLQHLGPTYRDFFFRYMEELETLNKSDFFVEYLL